MAPAPQTALHKTGGGCCVRTTRPLPTAQQRLCWSVLAFKPPSALPVRFHRCLQPHSHPHSRCIGFRGVHLFYLQCTAPPMIIVGIRQAGISARLLS